MTDAELAEREALRKAVELLYPTQGEEQDALIELGVLAEKPDDYKREHPCDLCYDPDDTEYVCTDPCYDFKWIIDRARGAKGGE